MNGLLTTLYAGVGAVAQLAVTTGVPGDGKLAQGINARRGLLDRYRTFARTGRRPNDPLVWFHAPSVGEGLQATPVMARVRARRPDVQQAYTHFSPSAAGFAQRTGADFADYLPFDSGFAMRAALGALQPTALIFSKLDVWPVLVAEAVSRRVRVGMISATMSEGSGRSGALAQAFTRDAYASLAAVGAIDDRDAARLAAIGVRESVIRVTGDTRYDQVWARAMAARESAPWLQRFIDAPRRTLVAGSTWPGDEAVLLPAWASLAQAQPGRTRLIIAPHEPTPAHLAPVEAWATAAGLRCARLDAPGDSEADVVLVDRVGVLGDLYALADAAWVGGGFHAAGLHSVLEPAAFGAPVLFGPRHSNSRDAGLLLEGAGARCVDSTAAAHTQLSEWLAPGGSGTDSVERAAAGARARALVERGLGAADRATELVLELLSSR